MAVSASFYRNVSLLNQLVPPSDDFKKVFREGMFDKPNIAGFIHVSHYLLMIFDARRFKNLIEWPVICKKMEGKYRNNVRDYLNIIALENPDIGFPNILATYLHHASGTKFMVIMWKLSQLVMKSYIARSGEYVVLFVPKLGPVSDLFRIYQQQSNTNIICDILSHNRNCIQMEKAVNLTLEEEKERSTKIKAELFDKKQAVLKCTAVAPVAISIKQRLANVKDSEIIQMWKNSLDENIRYLKKRYTILKDLEKTCENMSSIISNLSNDAKTLDSKQLKEINCSLISELPFPPDIQHCLYHVYNDNKLVFCNFIRLLTFILYQVHRSLRKGNLVDLSQCLLQVQASTEDIKSMYNVFKTFFTSIINSIEEIQSDLCDKNVKLDTSEKNVLPFIKSVLFIPSPLIKINTNRADEKNDLHKLLQFTPREIAHKSLFSRYVRHNQNHAQNLKTNLFVSHISVDNTLLDNNEKQDLSMRFVIPKVNKLSKRRTEKYSRLFSTCTNKTVKGNSSMMSLPSTIQTNSSAIISRIGDTFDFNLEMTAQKFLNLSGKSPTIPYTTVQLTPIKQNILRNISQEETRNKFDYEFKINNSKLDEFTEIQFANDESKSTIIKHENASKKLSIGDLVERYKKLLESRDIVTTKFQNECIEPEIK